MEDYLPPLVGLPLPEVTTPTGCLTTLQPPTSDCTPGPEQGNSAQKCFRISGVPAYWTYDQLLEGLRSLDPSFPRDHRLSLYPACCGPTQTALLNLDMCTEYFARLRPNKFNYAKITGVTVGIDDHFYNLTPLNKPKGEILAECVPLQHRFRVVGVLIWGLIQCCRRGRSWWPCVWVVEEP